MLAKSFISCAVLAFLCKLCWADNWPQWRGPRGDGISEETGIPIRWNETENVLWKTPIPGKGHSSPVVWDDRVFITTCLEKEQKRLLLCLDRHGGKVIWQRTVLTAPLEPKHPLNSYASSTPATDGHFVWVTFLNMPKFEVYCYDFDGNLVWQRSPGEFHSKHGFCSPPILYKNMIILNGDQDAESYLVALDKTTGEDRWRTDRPNRVRSYCPPFLIESAGRKQFVLTGSLCTAGYDPGTGKQIWIVDGPTEQFVASMVSLPGIVFLTAGFPEYHVMAIRPDGHGNVTKTHVLWHEHCDASKASYVPSPIAHDKYFFLVTDNGFAYCLDAKTGKRLWQHRLGDHHSASPISAGSLLYFPDDDGTTYVLKGTNKFELVSRNKLAEGCRASPAISDGQIFTRTLCHLYCIGEHKKAANTRRQLSVTRIGSTSRMQLWKSVTEKIFQGSIMCSRRLPRLWKCPMAQGEQCAEDLRPHIAREAVKDKSSSVNPRLPTLETPSIFQDG